MTDPTRRQVLQGAAVAAGTVLAGAGAGRAAAPNDVINVGLIGTGGRCRHLMKSLAKVPGARMAAVCDVWDVHLAKGAELADPKARRTKNWREILDDKGIDAVLIGTPDHWHAPMTIEAVKAGKDVYVEKPVTHDLDEGAALIEAVEKSGRVVQIGTQQRSMPHIRQGRELIAAGKIGKVVKVRMSWNRNTDRVRRNALGVDPKSVDWKGFLGPAREQPFDEYRFRNWRWFWDFGNGIFTDLMVHWIDVAHWCLDVDHPTKAVSIGSFNAAAGVWETPDTVQTLLTYPGNVQMHFEGTFSNADNGAHIEFLGTEGSLYLDRGRLELVPEPRSKAEPIENILGKGRRGADFYEQPDGELLHLTDWVEAIRSKRAPSAPVRAGVGAAAAAHLANKALRGSGVAEWK